MKIKDRELLFCIVKQCIDEWNPYLLLADEPDDEFDRESRSVASKIELDSTTAEIAKIISTVFSSSFEPQSFQREHCMEVAEKVMYRMKNMGRFT